MALDQLDYRWATGASVALASLSNVARSLKPYMQNKLVPPTSQPIDIFPIRRVPLSGKERGEGNLSTVWFWSVMTPEALDYIIDTFLTTGGFPVVSKAITIYTPQQDIQTITRWNAEICYPKPPNPVRGEAGDYRFERGYIRDLSLRFRSLEPL